MEQVTGTEDDSGRSSGFHNLKGFKFDGRRQEKDHPGVRDRGPVNYHDITGNKRTVKSKVYNQTTLVAEASQDGDDPDPTFLAEDQMQEDEVLELLLQEGDSDALLVHDFECLE